ncbi:MAG: L-histidine N(alpha)-methyltransferase [Hyphomicrobiaceae bacterium]
MRTRRAAAPVEASSDFAGAMLDGLSGKTKSIPCRFLYDARGDDLFEEITRLPEYYPSRAEIEVLESRAGEIDSLLADGAVLIELGSGSSRKTQILLDRLAPRLAAYVPMDISPAALASAKERLSARYPDLDIRPLEGDFSSPIELPKDLAARPKLCFFPGSTIGNLEQRQAVDLLRNLAVLARPDGFLLIGVDLKKDASIIVPAYNDAAGVTADFNLNLLVRSNRELGSNFDIAQFRHEATYDWVEGRIDMYLVSKRDQTVSLLGRRITFKAGERIHTETSRKYDLEGFAALARRGGWEPVEAWTDRKGLFSVHLLRT